MAPKRKAKADNADGAAPAPKMSAYQAYVSLGLLVAAMPTLFGDAYQGLESHRRGHYANLSAQNDFQMWLAFCVFLIYFRALK